MDLATNLLELVKLVQKWNYAADPLVPISLHSSTLLRYQIEKMLHLTIDKLINLTMLLNLATKIWNFGHIILA